jgi:hypothetical protein
MSKKISHTLVGGRTVAGTGGQGLKVGSKGKLYWLDVDEVSLIPPVWYGGRGIFAGGEGSSNVIQYITISSTGNATDFGDILAGASSLAGCSSGSRGVFGGGGSSSNVIQYITVASTGNSTDFGDLTVGRYGAGGTSNGTRGVFLGGYETSAGWDGKTIDYITISTTGNATDFGDLSALQGNGAACTNGTRGVQGGNQGGSSDAIEYITIASTGNATDFGDLTGGNTEQPAAAADLSDRGIWAGGVRGGGSGSNIIDYITITSTGNATDFGDATVARYGVSGLSNGTRGAFAGGAGAKNEIDYITIANTGNATDFGDLLSGGMTSAPCSGD